MTKSKKILNIFTAVIIGLFLACTVASFAIRAKTQPKVENAESLVERYAVESGRTYEDLDEVNSIINKNASSDEEQK